MAEYVVYPGGTNHFNRKSANDKAKQVSREDGYAYVQNRYTLKIVAEFHDGKRDQNNPMAHKKRETKAERLMRQQKARRKRAIGNAAGSLMKQLNPSRRISAVRVKRLKGGGVSLIPVKVKRP